MQENETGEIPDAADQVSTTVNESEYGEQSQEKNVPIEALQAERAQRQNLQEELRVIKDHLALMQSQGQQKQQEAPKDPWDSLSEDDVLTVGDAKKYVNKMNQDMQMSIQEMRMIQMHPDYQEVVTKYLPEVLKQKPSLRKTLQQTQDYELAYYLGKNSDAYRNANRSKETSANAQRIVKNSEQSGSLSSIGSAAPLNQAKNYKEMPDSEFRKLVNRNMGYF